MAQTKTQQKLTLVNMNIRIQSLFLAVLLSAAPFLQGDQRKIVVPGDYEFVGNLVDVSASGYYLYKVTVKDGESLELFKKDGLIPKNQSLHLKLNDQIVDLYGADELKNLKGKRVKIVVTGDIRVAGKGGGLHYEFLVNNIYELEKFKK